jgi:MFS family permease
MKSPEEKRPRVDPGRIIVATTFVTLVVIYGIWYSYSVFLVALVRQFGWSRSFVSGAFSLFVLVHGSLGPVVGWMARRFGVRRLLVVGGVVMGAGLALTAETRQVWHLYLAFGGITAVGISLAGWVPAVILVQGWLPQRFGTAMGIASAGIGVGILGLIPLAQFLIDLWGWQWALRIEAALTVGWLLPAAYWLVRDPPALSGASAELRETPADRGQAYWTIASAIRTWRFWGVAVVYFTGNFVTQMLMIHQIAYLVDHGVSAMTAAAIGGAVGLVSIGAKVGWGILSDRNSRETACTLAFGCVAASIGMLVLAGRHPTSSLSFAYAVLIALGYGVLSPVFPAVASDLFAGPGFSTIYGTLYAVICLGLAAGAWSAGKIFDVTGSYSVALWIGLAMAVLTPALLWVVAPRRPNPAALRTER